MQGEADSLSTIVHYPEGKAEAYRLIGIYYDFQGNYPKALKYYQMALKIGEELKDKNIISRSYNNIGIIYEIQLDYELALNYYLKSLEIKEDIGDTYGMINTLNNIGNIYRYLKEYSNALEYFKRSLQLSKDINNKTGISMSTISIGLAYNNMGDKYQAIEYYKNGLNLAEELENVSFILWSTFGLGMAYFDLEKLDIALEYAEKAYKLALEINEKEQIKFSSGLLSEIYAAKGNFEKAYTYQVKFKNQSDSLVNEAKTKEITALELQYTFEKEKELAQAEQEKIDAVKAEEIKQHKAIRNLFIIGFLLLLFLVFILIRSYLFKRKANFTLTEQKQEIESMNSQLTVQKDELESANKTKNKFFSIIAHDLKSPFNAILGFSDLLLNNHKDYDENKREELIKFIHTSSKSAYILMENLFDWARSQSGNIEFSPERLNLNELVQKVITNASYSASQKEIKLKNLLNEEILVNADKNMLSTILRNLISNAVKFTERGGEISVYYEKSKESKHHKVVVKDNGIGMSVEKAKSLFQLDKNQSSEGTDKEKGTGLGLILCKEFIEKHQGKIKVESIEGKGSEFIISLPE
jgi:signal transduction histidine kinase